MKNFSIKSKFEDQPLSTDHMHKKPLTAPTMQQLRGKVAIITGGDSGIGKAVALLFAQHGMRMILVYYNEHKDAKNTLEEIESLGGVAFSIHGDIRKKSFSEEIIKYTIKQFGQIDIVINNAGVQYPQKKIEDISEQQLYQTFEVNIFGMIYLIQSAIPFLKEGARIINTSSITAVKGHETLLDYSATKGAIISLTKSLALQLKDQKIIVSAVAPGPVWTPLIPSSFSQEEIDNFGEDTMEKRAAEAHEIALAYLFLIDPRNKFMTGQTLHINGGSYLY